MNVRDWGQIAKIWDCPGRSGTVGTYEIRQKTCGTVTLSCGQMERNSKIIRRRILQWLQPHRREKCFAKQEEVIHSHRSKQVSFKKNGYAFSCICSRDQISRLVPTGIQSPEPIDETNVR